MFVILIAMEEKLRLNAVDWFFSKEKSTSDTLDLFRTIYLFYAV